MSILSFKNLKIWQESLDLTCEIYKITRCFPEVERYGLTSQLRRSSAAVGANIAKGHCRRSTKDYIRFLNIARASANESIHHLLLAQRLNYIEDKEVDRLVGRYEGLSAGIMAYIYSLQKRPVTF